MPRQATVAAQGRHDLEDRRRHASSGLCKRFRLVIQKGHYIQAPNSFAASTAAIWYGGGRSLPMSIKARQAEDEPDYLKELLAQAGIDAQASSVAARLQEVVIR